MQPHQQRVVNEKNELEKKRVALAWFINSDAFKAVVADEQTLLKRECAVMELYLSILDERIGSF